MQKNIIKIKEQVKKECLANKRLPSWFYSDHLLMVEKNAKSILRKLPKADKQVVLLGVWLHDLQRVRGFKGDQDQGTPPEHQQLLFDAVPSEKEIHIIKDAPHTFETKEHLEEVYNCFNNWIKNKI